MKNLQCILALLFISTISLHAKFNPKNYYPLKDGYKWIYKIATISTAEEYEKSIKGQVIIDGMVYYNECQSGTCILVRYDERKGQIISIDSATKKTSIRYDFSYADSNKSEIFPPMGERFYSISQREIAGKMRFQVCAETEIKYSGGYGLCFVEDIGEYYSHSSTGHWYGASSASLKSFNGIDAMINTVRQQRNFNVNKGEGKAQFNVLGKNLGKMKGLNLGTAKFNPNY